MFFETQRAIQGQSGGVVPVTVTREADRGEPLLSEESHVSGPPSQQMVLLTVSHVHLCCLAAPKCLTPSYRSPLGSVTLLTPVLMRTRMHREIK